MPAMRCAHVQHLVKSWIWRLRRACMHEGGDFGTLLFRNWQHFFAINPQHALFPFADGVAVEICSALAAAQFVEQCANHALRVIALDLARLVQCQRSARCFRHRERCGSDPGFPLHSALVFQRRSGRWSRNVPAPGWSPRLRGFVEIVYVEVGEAVIAFLAAEIFHVQVAADLGGRFTTEQVAVREPFVE